MFLIRCEIAFRNRSADGTCRVWGLSDAANAQHVEDGVEIPIAASVMPHAQYIGTSKAVFL